MEKEIEIPEGCEARIEGNKVILELTESKDKQIIDALTKRIQDMYDNETAIYEGVQVSDILAWLERQKEPADGDFARGYDCGYECCLHSHGAEWFEKQKEQKSNLEPIKQSWYTEGYIDGKFKKEPMWYIKTGKGGPRYEKNEKYGQLLEQKPAEWSEEDKRNFYWISTTIQERHLTPEYTKQVHKILTWLKSLRPQSHWKPSEEQMKELYAAAREAPIVKESGNYLYDLYNDLKKLM